MEYNHCKLKKMVIYMIDLLISKLYINNYRNNFILFYYRMNDKRFDIKETVNRNI